MADIMFMYIYNILRRLFLRPRVNLHADNSYPPPSISFSFQDEFSSESHRRAARAQSNGVFIDEIVPVQIKGGKIVTADDGIRWC